MTELDKIFSDLPELPDDDGLGVLWIDDSAQLTPVYRMPERDAVTGPKPDLPDDTLITYSRIVARVGYEFGMHSLTRRERNQAGLEIIAEHTGLPVETVKRVVIALRLDKPFNGIYREIYDTKIRPLTHRGNNRNIRAMWFYDYDKPRTGRITGRTIKLTGNRISGGRSGYYGEDYDPPVLCATGRQVLYKVTNYQCGENVLVYPTDCKKV